MFLHIDFAFFFSCKIVMCVEDEKAKWAAEKGRNGERGMGIH